MKQMSKILSEVNYDLSSIKLVKCVAAHNEQDWITFNLANNYEEYDVIRVIEGAVEGRPNSTKDGHSTDRTLELIRSFPDPQNKIELFVIDRPFKSLEEQKQLFLDVAKDGEWLFIVDCDEFYMDGEISKIRSFIHRHPSATEFIPTFLHFYRDFWHIRDFEDEWNLWHQRIIKYQRGMRYHTHPVVTDKNGRCTYFSPEYQYTRYQMPGTYIYHYGHAKGKEFHAMKRDFYRSELEKFAASDGKTAADAFDEKFLEFVNETENLERILRFDGEHPSVMKSHPAFIHHAEKYQKHYEKCADSGTPPLIRHWKSALAYAEKNLPTIPQWMLFQKKMQPVYNVVA